MSPEDREKLQVLASSLAPLVMHELAKGLGPVAQNLGAHFSHQAGPAIMKMLITPVKVKRYDENDNLKEEMTTVPQLLAEINDNMLDLIDVIAESNDCKDEPRKLRKRK